MTEITDKPKRRRRHPLSIQVTRFGGVQRPSDDRADEPLTLAELQEGLEIAARLVEVDGEVMLPLFERMEREVEAARNRASAVDRARRIAEAARSRDPESAR